MSDHDESTLSPRNRDVEKPQFLMPGLFLSLEAKNEGKES